MNDECISKTILDAHTIAIDWYFLAMPSISFSPSILIINGDVIYSSFIIFTSHEDLNSHHVIGYTVSSVEHFGDNKHKCFQC